MPEPKRLFFGNPTKSIRTKPLPKGERKAFGEAQPEPANAPVLHPDVTVLCYGNHPINPQRDEPFKVVDGKPAWPTKPKD